MTRFFKHKPHCHLDGCKIASLYIVFVARTDGQKTKKDEKLVYFAKFITKTNHSDHLA